MRLDRHINQDGRGKYALLKLRRQELPISPEAMEAAELLKREGLLQFGNETEDAQFFVLKYTDKFAVRALEAYARAVWAEAARMGDPGLVEFAEDMDREVLAAEKYGTRVPT